METNVYSVLKCSEIRETNPSTAGVEKQNYVVAEIVKVNTNEKLAQFKNLIIGSKPFNLVFFEDQGVFFDMVQQPEAYIAGNVVVRKTKPYYVVDSSTGESYKYMKGPLKGRQVVANSVKFFLHDGQDEDVEFRKVMAQNAETLVPAGELSVYANHLGLDEAELLAQGIDIKASEAKANADADLLTGGAPAPPVPPVTPPVQPPAPPAQ